MARFILISFATIFSLASCTKFSASVAPLEEQVQPELPIEITILTPNTENTLSGEISASASIINSPSPATLQWRIDGVNIGSALTMSPYFLVIDTSSIANGQHTLSANVIDGLNNNYSRSIILNVSNNITPPVIPPVTPIADINYQPSLIDFSAPEIVNPLRGLYKWRGNELYRLNAPTPDVYDRYTWRNLETSRDVYDFTALDNAIAAAAATGAKFGFRVRSMLGYGDNNMHVPSYMSQYGWWADTTRNGTADTYIPDWNHSVYLDRAIKLIEALGVRYGNDPRVSFLDIGLFGQYGEWTISSSRVDYSSAPSGIVPITMASKRLLIDAYVRAFPKKQLLMFMLHSNFEAILYAYNLSTEVPIGARVDCLGQQGFFTQWTNRPDVWNQIKDRWRVAPLITEYCSGYIVYDDPNTQDDALGQVETFHVSMIGNGNVNWGALSSTEQTNYVTVAKRSGYRISLTQFKMPSIMTRGIASNLITSWINQGVAPVYENWSVVVELRHPQTQVSVYLKELNIPLKSLLPASNSTDYTDSLIIPTSVSAGNYEVILKVLDPTGYRKNMALANHGASSEIDYYIGMMELK